MVRVVDDPTGKAKVRHDLFISAVVSLFDEGLDTYQISRTLGEPEASIERKLHRGLDERRKLLSGGSA